MKIFLSGERDLMKRLRVCEIFASIQGESSYAGFPCVLCGFRDAISIAATAILFMLVKREWK